MKLFFTKQNALLRLSIALSVLLVQACNRPKFKENLEPKHAGGSQAGEPAFEASAEPAEDKPRDVKENRVNSEILTVSQQGLSEGGNEDDGVYIGNAKDERIRFHLVWPDEEDAKGLIVYAIAPSGDVQALAEGSQTADVTVGEGIWFQVRRKVENAIEASSRACGKRQKVSLDSTSVATMDVCQSENQVKGSVSLRLVSGDAGQNSLPGPAPTGEAATVLDYAKDMTVAVTFNQTQVSLSEVLRFTITFKRSVVVQGEIGLLVDIGGTQVRLNGLTLIGSNQFRGESALPQNSSFAQKVLSPLQLDYTAGIRAYPEKNGVKSSRT